MEIYYKNEESKFEEKRKEIYYEAVSSDVESYIKDPEWYEKWARKYNKFSDIMYRFSNGNINYITVNFIREVGVDKFERWGSFYNALFFDYIKTDDEEKKKEIEGYIKEFRFQFYEHVRYIRYGIIDITPDNYKKYLTKKN